jgi:hypothetical protein
VHRSVLTNTPISTHQNTHTHTHTHTHYITHLTTSPTHSTLHHSPTHTSTQPYRRKWAEGIVVRPDLTRGVMVAQQVLYPPAGEHHIARTVHTTHAQADTTDYVCNVVAPQLVKSTIWQRGWQSTYSLPSVSVQDARVTACMMAVCTACLATSLPTEFRLEGPVFARATVQTRAHRPHDGGRTSREREHGIPSPVSSSAPAKPLESSTHRHVPSDGMW